MRNFHTLFLPYGSSVYFLCTVAENTVTQLQPAQYAAWLSSSVLFPLLLSPRSFPLAYSVSVLLSFGLWKTWVKPSQYFRQFVVFEVPEGWTFVRGGKVFGIYKNIPLCTNKVTWTWTILITMRGMYLTENRATLGKVIYLMINTSHQTTGSCWNTGNWQNQQIISRCSVISQTVLKSLTIIRF